MTNGKTVKELRAFGRSEIGITDSDALIKSLLDCDEIYLTVHSNDALDEQTVKKYEKYVERRKTGESVAYITNQKEFMSLPFYVNENVLVPRCETELLVEEIINAKCEKSTILDLCTGSGAIAVSLAYYLKNTEILGADISDGALEVAQKNAESILRDNKNIAFKKCNVLSELESIGKKYDVVVSNPPYIESDVIPTLDTDVKDFEPHLALDGGQDGLVFYRAIAENIGCILKKGGYLFFEIGYNQGKKVSDILSAAFCDIKVIKDYAGLDRIVTAKYTG